MLGSSPRSKCVISSSCPEQCFSMMRYSNDFYNSPMLKTNPELFDKKKCSLETAIIGFNSSERHWWTASKKAFASQYFNVFYEGLKFE
jgi:hypothetical protein